MIASSWGVLAAPAGADLTAKLQYCSKYRNTATRTWRAGLRHPRPFGINELSRTVRVLRSFTHRR
jgi:hypothetical protein